MRTPFSKIVLSATLLLCALNFCEYAARAYRCFQGSVSMGWCPGVPTDPPHCDTCPCPPPWPPPPPPPPPDLPPPPMPTNSATVGCSSCASLPRGLAYWWVSEPRINLRVEDEPIGYEPGRGPRVNFHLSYRQRESIAEYTNFFGVGTNWTCSLREFLLPDSQSASRAFLQSGGASWSTFIVGKPQPRNGSLVTVVSSTNYKIEHRDGSVDTYSTVCTNSDGDILLFLTTKADPAGNAVSYGYSTNSGIFRLDTVTDADGHVTHLYYENGSFPNQITKVVDPFSRTNLLAYNAAGYLTNSIDPVGLPSSFVYDSNSWMTNLVTPYGTTSFRFGGVDATNDVDWFGSTNISRFAEVTLPTGGRHLYVYIGDCTNFLGSWAPAIPNTTPFGNTFEQTNDLSYFRGNSFYWGPLQYKTLSTTNPASLTATDFAKGRLRHWLYDGSLTSALSIERAPSPDGVTEGQLTWYDFENKDPSYPWITGDSDFPSFIATVLPGGSTHYTYSLRGPHLNVTNEVSTYSALDGTVAVRTNAFIYAANAIDLLQWVGPRGEQVRSNYFSVGNTIHAPDTSYDALNQATVYTYNGYGQVTSIKTPAGLTTTNIYFSSGDSVNRLNSRVEIEILATNSWTYATGLVLTHTYPRSLTVTNSWDGLQRLTNVAYPDGSIVYVYTNLDIAAVKDRLGHWRYFGYNGIRQLIASTNENSVITRYGYCDCGALLALTNAWNTSVQQITTFDYDNQGNRTFVYGADGYNVTNWFDSLGRIEQTSDGTTYRNFYFNNQGLVTNVSKSAGPERETVFDIEDRAVYVTDINGVTVTNTYDDLDRLLTRTYPDNGVERFGYSARGMIAYTNQIGATNFYAYDEAMRKTVDSNANGEVIRYTNSAAGDLVSLTDGKSQTTRWRYDEYGRVTNKTDQAGTEILRYKYDANSRLTNRWSVEKGNTGYLWDNVGNLTKIDYPSSTDVTFTYDSLDRASNMVDAVGTTIYSYTAGNQLLTEDGPFTSDTITNVYVNRLRTQLSLQQPTGFWTNGFTYDNGARLSNVIMSAGTFLYLYPGSGVTPRPSRITLPNTSFITNIYDGNARLTSTALKKNDGTTVLDSYVYIYDPANERTNLTRADSSTVGYAYDKIGQLTIADSSVAGEDRGYKYDAAWNLNWLTNSGTATRFDVNVLNELTNGPISTNYYDSNGNLTNNAYDIAGDGATLTYDDENRLIDIFNPITGLETVLVYDGLGRLRIRQEYATGGGESPQPLVGEGAFLSSETHYIYDGWRVIQERNASNVPQVSYTRGSDLSGSMEGAGGIGGLLARSHGYSSGNWSTHNYYFADGNGNVTYLVNSSQALAAKYRYDPFGNTISSSGTLADANVYRFSSKEIHPSSGMYYYGYRFYDPSLQRWMNRDPLEDRAFAPRSAADEPTETANLFNFVSNGPTGRTDALGLRWRYFDFSPMPPAPPCTTWWCRYQSCLDGCAADFKKATRDNLIHLLEDTPHKGVLGRIWDSCIVDAGLAFEVGSLARQNDCRKACLLRAR